MNEYIATSTVTFGVGARVRLSAAQAEPRAHCLSRIGKGKGGGVFDVAAPIQLKAGEAFGCADELPKALAEMVKKADAPRAPRGDEKPPAGDGPPPPPAGDDQPPAGDLETDNDSA